MLFVGALEGDQDQVAQVLVWICGWLQHIWKFLLVQLAVLELASRCARNKRAVRLVFGHLAVGNRLGSGRWRNWRICFFCCLQLAWWVIVATYVVSGRGKFGKCLSIILRLLLYLIIFDRIFLSPIFKFSEPRLFLHYRPLFLLNLTCLSVVILILWILFAKIIAWIVRLLIFVNDRLELVFH